MRYTFFASIITMLALSGCENDGRGGPRATKVDPEPVVETRPSPECSCQGAQEIYASNKSKSQKLLSFNMLIEQTDANRSCVAKKNLQLPAKSKRTLGCTIGGLTDEIQKACQGFSSTGNDCAITQTPETLVSDADHPPVSCLSACNVGTFNPEICTKINSSVSRPVYRSRVNQIASLFSANQHEIPKASFMALFDDDDDKGCNRQNILLGSRDAPGKVIFENTGDTGSSDLECSIEGRSPILGDLDILIPEFLKGVFSTIPQSPNEFKLVFVGQGTKPRLRFDNPILNEAYGGSVKEVYWVSNRIIVSVGNSCLASDL